MAAPIDGSGVSAESRAAGTGRARRAVGVALALQAVVLAVMAGTQDPALRSVTAAVGGSPRQLVSQVDVAVALVVVVALLAIGRFVPPGGAAWVDPLLTTPITVFVIAELNGVDDLGALVGIYALASAGVLFAMMPGAGLAGLGGPGRGAGGGDGSRRALGYGAAVGIVPWGIVAFQQVGAMAVGSPESGLVVLITLVALVFAIAEFVAVWRRADAVATGGRILGLSIVAWLVVAAL